MPGYIESQYEKSMDTKNYRKRKDKGRLCEIGKKYSYFDQTKLVVNETEVKDSKIPVVSGLKIKKNKLYSQIKTTNQTKFSEIVEACGESQRYGIYPKRYM